MGLWTDSAEVLRVGTMCSGTDAPVLVARPLRSPGMGGGGGSTVRLLHRALERALRPHGSELSFQHAGSLNARKRLWASVASGAQREAFSVEYDVKKQAGPPRPTKLGEAEAEAQPGRV